MSKKIPARVERRDPPLSHQGNKRPSVRVIASLYSLTFHNSQFSSQQSTFLEIVFNILFYCMGHPDLTELYIYTALKEERVFSL